ncbi:GntP family permease [Sphingomonas sp. PL-96]|uniref:GntT/GntP/DsdX family permease n=1 Tax=Sphingomonas sp. PL-96 TaxID=2887201 RepID=UPI001E4E424E|nr:gluconate:H+ symporter [Sphingomonas sp. PL-96]MCC2977073.1 GntP family permease [Sphingomonas sp. PL-96]
MIASPGPWLSGPGLLGAAGAAVLVLILLIAWVRLNPFVALVLVSLVLGLVVGIPPADVVGAFEKGVGNTLGHIALVVGLGTILGKMMIESGGAAVIADRLIGAFGPRRTDWAMMSVALLVGLPVFFEVGFVLLVPIVLSAARRTGLPLIRAGLPMAAGLSVVHALVPPHPAALLAVTAYGADIGLTILYALLIGIPSAILAGPLLARVVAKHVSSGLDTEHEPVSSAPTARTGPPPGFGITLSTLLLPVALMLLGAAAPLLAPAGSVPFTALRFVGNSVVALLIASLVSFWTLGLARGLNRETILRFCNESLAPTAVITLVVGGGAGFGRILLDGGVSGVLIDTASSFQVPLLLLGWSVAALLRIATGSATVAMATASGIVAPLAHASPHVSAELLVIATGAGSVVLSHVNDGGFWLVKEYFGLSVGDTLKSWTVCETIISIAALLGACLASALI